MKYLIRIFNEHMDYLEVYLRYLIKLHKTKILIYKFIYFYISYINLKNIKRYNNIELLIINNMVNFFI